VQLLSPYKTPARRGPKGPLYPVCTALEVSGE
jgi:hypothetical protein